MAIQVQWKLNGFEYLKENNHRYRKMKRLSVVFGLSVVLNVDAGVRPESSTDGTVRWEQKGNRSDNFNGSTLNTKLWNNAPKSLNVGAWTFDENNAYVKDGKLNIKATQETHTRSFHDSCWDGQAGGSAKLTQRELFYKSGAVQTYADGVYGYYEASIKGVDIFPGLSPAFWLYSDGHPYKDKGSGKGQYVDYSEIDIVELQQADWRSPTDVDGISDMDHNLHARVEENGRIVWKRPKPNPETQLLHYSAPFDPSKGFHTYAVENRKDKILWYVDGKLIGSKPNTWWHRPMHVIFSMGLRRHLIKYNSRCQRADPNPDNIVSDGFPERATMQVDYVKTWEALPSIWFSELSGVDKQTFNTNKPASFTINYHAGSHYFVEKSKLNGVTLQLIEKNAKGKFIRLVESVEDNSTTSESKKYGGKTSLTLSFSDVTPSANLPEGHYYTLLASFSSSNGSVVYPIKRSPHITVQK